MIKPEYYEDEKLAGVSIQARYLFPALWVYADDNGNLKGNVSWVCSKVFPYGGVTLSEVKRWLEELEKLGRIMFYEVEGEKFINIVNFRKHQKIDRPSKHNLNPVAESSTSPRRVLDDEDKLSKDKLSKDNINTLVVEIIDDLNLVRSPISKRKYPYDSKETIKKIKARLAEGYVLADFKHVHRVKFAEWADNLKMRKFFRPSTLYAPSHFSEYLAEEMATVLDKLPTQQRKNIEESLKFLKRKEKELGQTPVVRRGDSDAKQISTDVSEVRRLK